MDKTKQLDELMKEWKQYYMNQLGEDFSYFINDGLIDEETWNHQRGPKICYILKEAYFDGHKDNGLIEWIQQGPQGLWNKLTVWTDAIKQTDVFESPIYCRHEIKDNANKLSKSIAFINIKKYNGSKTLDYEELMKVAQDTKNKKLIRKELEIINPDIIICGGTFQMLNCVLEGEIEPDNSSETLFTYWKDKIIINFYHPAARFSQSLNFYSLCAIYKAALANYPNNA